MALKISEKYENSYLYLITISIYETASVKLGLIQIATLSMKKSRDDDVKVYQMSIRGLALTPIPHLNIA